MDNISKDALAAVQAGMTYGKWKVLHPHTNPDANANIGDLRTRRECFEVCPVCGKVFEISPRHKVTCSPRCQTIRNRENHRNYVRRKREQGG